MWTEHQLHTEADVFHELGARYYFVRDLVTDALRADKITDTEHVADICAALVMAGPSVLFAQRVDAVLAALDKMRADQIELFAEAPSRMQSARVGANPDHIDPTAAGSSHACCAVGVPDVDSDRR